ncbi:hypothetical protein TNCV_838731 [Trichonephila clavipes]|nr:hypothetical protein TNCV_838731 [Trichonephila clavipes]
MCVPSHPLKPFALAIGLTRLYEARSININLFSERARAVLNDAHLNNINIQENNILAFPPWDIHSIPRTEGGSQNHTNYRESHNAMFGRMLFYVKENRNQMVSPNEGIPDLEF